jgi:hypothetical protein
VARAGGWVGGWVGVVVVVLLLWWWGWGWWGWGGGLTGRAGRVGWGGAGRGGAAGDCDGEPARGGRGVPAARLRRGWARGAVLHRHRLVCARACVRACGFVRVHVFGGGGGSFKPSACRYPLFLLIITEWRRQSAAARQRSCSFGLRAHSGFLACREAACAAFVVIPVAVATFAASSQ